MKRPFLLHHLLLEAASARPDDIALLSPRERRTYGELEDESARIASGLAESGVRPGALVGVVMEKTPRAIACLYAILRRGAAYVPLDPSLPRARLTAMIERAELAHLVVDLEHVEAVRAACASDGTMARKVVVAKDLVDAPRGASVDAGGTDGQLAYVLHTSGSTGVPKGVAISHRNALAFVEPACARFELQPSDVLACQAPLHFDLSVFDVFGAASVGAGVSLFPSYFSAFPRKMAETLEVHGVSVWNSVVSALATLVLRGALEDRSLDRMRAILFSGERMPGPLLRALAARFPHARLFNVYGQTEANSSMVHEIDARDLEHAETRTLPLGDALDNAETFVLDDELREVVGAGQVGELYVRSAAVASGGYLHDPLLTAERFLLDPRHPETGARAFRTGDLVERGERGELYFRQRRDTMIKTRGHRVELAEIEIALESMEGVYEVAVVAVPDTAIGHRLAAFVRPREGLTLSSRTVEAWLRERLPRYMVPDVLEVRAELPRTSTGKIDRARLVASVTAPQAVRAGEGLAR
jgi:amino acid adenylation domain-containing protein